MAKAKTAEKTKAADKPAEQAKPASAQAVAALSAPENEKPTGMRLRIKYPPAWGERNKVTPDTWRILLDSAWPNAKTAEAVTLAYGYCMWRKLDPLKKMIHIVPIWDRSLEVDDGHGNIKKGGWSEGVWPGIAEIRVTATRTGAYAGKDAMEFGPSKTRTFKGKRVKWVNRQKAEEEYDVELTYPEWARLTVYKIVQGIVCKFVGPQVLWEEAYATESRESEAPNEMWADRKQGQLDKCAEAAALRAAFPEELGGEQSSEEMYGRVVDHAPIRDIPGHVPLLPGEVRPKANLNSEFKPVGKADPAAKTGPAKNDVAKPAEKGGDPRGEAPPLEGESPREQTQQQDHANQGQDGEEAAEPQDDDEAPALAQKRVADLLHDATAKLDACTKVGQVADLREEIEQEIPPSFTKDLKDWNDACDTKQQMILAARTKK